MQLIKFKDEFTQLTLMPDLGGAIICWQRLKDGFDILRPLDLKKKDPTARQCAAFALIPWSNRIKPGEIKTANGSFNLSPNTNDSPFAMHGSTWQEAWEVIAQTESSLTLQCHSYYPVELAVKQHIELRHGCLKITFSLIHLDQRPFLHGYGWHPFFYRNENTLIKTEFQAIWNRDEQGLSTEEVDVPNELNFNTFKALPVTLIDHAFSKWNGNCFIQQPDKGYELHLNCLDTDYLILYCPPEQNFFCVEPVSHPINAHHLPNQPGLKYLRKNEKLEWQVSLSYKNLET